MFKKIFIDLCNQKGIAPTVVCKEIGLSNAAFSCWTDESIPRRATLQRIANYFDVSIEYLLGKSEDEQKEKTAVNDDFSNHEKKIIEAYRNNPDLQATIDRILGVQQEGQVLLWAAAQSEDNHAPKVIYMSKERWNKIQSAPDTDDPLL